MTAMITIDQILENWPNQAVLAKDLRVSYSTVAKWKARSSIPAAYWKRLVDRAQDRRLTFVTLEALASAHARDLDRRTDQDVAPGTTPVRGVASPDGPGEGYFSRFRHLRRVHFSTTAEIVDHVRGLRDEWDRR